MVGPHTQPTQPSTRPRSNITPVQFATIHQARNTHHHRPPPGGPLHILISSTASPNLSPPHLQIHITRTDRNSTTRAGLVVDLEVGGQNPGPRRRAGVGLQPQPAPNKAPIIPPPPLRRRPVPNLQLPNPGDRRPPNAPLPGTSRHPILAPNPTHQTPLHETHPRRHPRRHRCLPD